MKMLLKLVVLLSATVLTLAAPTDNVISTETANLEKNSVDLNEKSIDNKDSVVDDSKASTIEVNVQKELNPGESPVIEEILDKIDKSDITEVINEEKALTIKADVDSLMVSEETKIDSDTAGTPTKDETEDYNNKLTNTMLKTTVNEDYIKKITEETDKQLKDMASAVAEVVTSLPVPLRPETTTSFSEIVRKFISDLLKIPVVLLHAVSSAVATITNNKVNLPTPTYLTIQKPQGLSSKP